MTVAHNLLNEHTGISNSETGVTYGNNNKHNEKQKTEKKWNISLHLSHQIQILCSFLI